MNTKLLFEYEISLFIHGIKYLGSEFIKFKRKLSLIYIDEIFDASYFKAHSLLLSTKSGNSCGSSKIVSSRRRRSYDDYRFPYFPIPPKASFAMRSEIPKANFRLTTLEMRAFLNVVF